MLIENGRVFVDGAFREVSVRVENGRVADVGQLSPHGNETVRDASGCYVLPGFVDIHIHAYQGADCMHGEKAVRSMSRGLKKTGVAAFVPTTMSATKEETHAALCGIQAVHDAQETDGAYVLGAHMEAPFLNVEYKGAQRGECLLMPNLQDYEEMTKGISCVKLITLAPELPGALELIPELVRRGVAVCCGHTAAKAEEVHAAADVGLSQITHLFNAQTPLQHRSPGVVGAGLSDDRILCQVIADGIHLHPDTLRISALCKGASGIALISDSMEAAGMPDGLYELGGQRVVVRDGAARLENGVLAGSTLVLHRAVKNMITLAGIAPEVVIPMATSTPADSIHESRFGRIFPGACGTLVLMDEQFNLADVTC